MRCVHARQPIHRTHDRTPHEEHDRQRPKAQPTSGSNGLRRSNIRGPGQGSGDKALQARRLKGRKECQHSRASSPRGPRQNIVCISPSYSNAGAAIVSKSVIGMIGCAVQASRRWMRCKLRLSRQDYFSFWMRPKLRNNVWHGWPNYGATAASLGIRGRLLIAV